ncbi:MAG: hypothetical protein E4H14_10585 [Candidatus Thorarchaeota archaeon]|nr:MAG: hypothetical protein E4H14_10585 [Candidatus Thorarchaeota archaeon]
MQQEGEMDGVCRNLLLCEPLKRALKSEPLIVPGIGHVVCPYPGINLSMILNREYSEEQLAKNYKECL